MNLGLHILDNGITAAICLTGRRLKTSGLFHVVLLSLAVIISIIVWK